MTHALHGIIYVLLEEETGRVKIGWSGRSVAGRARSFQTGNSNTLKLIGLLPGTKNDEAALHRRFQRYRLPERREWFECCHEMKTALDAIIAERGMVPT